MSRRRRYMTWGSSVLGIAAALVLLLPLVTEGASQFASPAFQQQWSGTEGAIPNYWGPLATAREGAGEQYAEGTYNGQVGFRLVQYFDKARMELTNPANSVVTNGLLTVELKSGNVQIGDQTFAQKTPAVIGLAGDPGQPGPTYAALGQLPENSPQSTGAVSLRYDNATNTFASGAAATDPLAAFTTYLRDPNGRFGQSVPKAFDDFLKKIPGGYLGSMGYPISPAFQATVQVNTTPNVPVIIQAFQRRVLTYTPSNPAAFQVEFGNIGQHYFRWRYTILTTGTPTTAATATLTGTPTGTATVDATITSTPDLTATAYYQSVTATAASYNATSTVLGQGADATVAAYYQGATATAALDNATATAYYQGATTTAVSYNATNAAYYQGATTTAVSDNATSTAYAQGGPQTVVAQTVAAQNSLQTAIAQSVAQTIAAQGTKPAVTPNTTPSTPIGPRR